jgi:UDP-galactopyranose mutase
MASGNSMRGAGAGGGHEVLVVGAGISGATIARRAAEAGRRVLVVEKRDHVAGNCFDFVEENGLRVSRYGPHFFHTKSERVWAFVQRFAEWTPWSHRVCAYVKEADKYVPVPVNIDTVNELFSAGVEDEAGMAAWLAAETVPCASPQNSRDVGLARVGPRLYEMLFRNYSLKQWERDPADMDASVLARIPVRANRDDRYFTDPHQALPREGYTAFVQAMLAHPNIEVRLGVDYFAEEASLRSRSPGERVFYTGPIDRFYADRGLNKLEYRAVTFDWSTVETEANDTLIYPRSQTNFPSLDYRHTRITEYKHILGQLPKDERRVSVLATEHSVVGGWGQEFYPVPNERNRDLFARYKAIGDAERDVTFSGRLASYKYFNVSPLYFPLVRANFLTVTLSHRTTVTRTQMDEAILAALETADAAGFA